MSRLEPALAWSTPFPLIEMDPKAQYFDYKDQPSLLMSFCHNVYLRSLNFMLWQASRIEPSRLEAFLSYVHMWCDALREHHEIEEHIYFPMLEDFMGKGTLIDNSHQHRQLMKPVNAFETWIKEVRADLFAVSRWNAATFEQKVHAFATPLVEHLADEIETLRPEKIGPAMNQEQYNKISEAVNEHIKKNANPAFLCFYMCNHSAQSHAQAGFFPELPWIVCSFPKALLGLRKTQVDKIIRVWQWQSQTNELQFGVCDRWSRLKPLPAESTV